MDSPQHIYSVEYLDRHGDERVVLIAGVNFDDAVARFKWHKRHQEIRAVKYVSTLENWQ